MAYRKRRVARTSRVRSAPKRRTYRAPRRRAASGRKRAYGSGTQTLRIVLEQPSASSSIRPGLRVVEPHKAMF